MALPQKQLVYTQDAPTRIQGQNFELYQNKVATFPGGILGRHRKQIVISNEDGGTKLHVIDGDAEDPLTTTKKIMTVWPGTSITLFTSAKIYIKAIDGNVVVSGLNKGVQVLETFYI